METVHRVAKNTGVIFIGRVISHLFRAVTIIFLARYLGVSNFGVYSFVFAYLGFFEMLMDSGIAIILVREISRDRSKAAELIGNVIVMKIILSVFALVLACLIISFLKYPFDTKLLVYIASLGFLLSFGSLYVVIFEVDLKMEYPTLVNIFNSVVKLVLFLYLIFLNASLLWFIVAGIITNLPIFFFILRLSKRSIKPKFEVDFEIWKKLLKESWPVALTMVFIMIYGRIDQLMLFQMKGAEAVGHYAAAVRITEFLNFVPSAFMASVFPLLSQYSITSGEKLEKAYKLSFKYLATLIIPIAVGTCILSAPLIKVIYGQQFLNSIPVLKILIWSEVFVFLGFVHVTILISVGLQRLDLFFTSSSAIANIILNLLLIPGHGIAGAAIATLLSYGLGVPLSCVLKKTRRYGKALVSSTFKPLIAAGIMGCFSYFAFIFYVPFILIILSSGIIYFGVIVLIKGLDKQDREYFRRILVPTREGL